METTTTTTQLDPKFLEDGKLHRPFHLAVLVAAPL